MKPKLLLCMCIVLLLAVAQGQDEDPVVRLHPGLDQIVPPGAKLEKLADGFGSLDGPLWIQEGRRGVLLFSDAFYNMIRKWTPDGEISAFLERSGYTGPLQEQLGMQVDPARSVYYLVGSSGITLDPQGRVVFCAQGDRAVVRLEENGRRTVLADSFEGKPLNSPNDLVYKSDGALYFTDPLAGVRLGPKDSAKDSGKELAYHGVYRLHQGKLELLSKDLQIPNGLAFSPNEKHLYVTDASRRAVLRFDVLDSGGLAASKVFVDMSSEEGQAPDGIKVDQKGNVYATGPGGVWILSGEGTRLGTISTPERVSNLAFGDADGKTLYLTGRRSLYRIRLNASGAVLRHRDR